MPIAAENRDRYPANWGSEIRPRVLRRAGLRCECEGECGRGHRTRCPERHLQPSVWGRRGEIERLRVGVQVDRRHQHEPRLGRQHVQAVARQVARRVSSDASDGSTAGRYASGLVACPHDGGPPRARAGAWLELARRSLGAAIAQARMHGGQVNELAAAAGISRPRLYRLERLAATVVPA